jgi:GNAT superfamily N-acetyltransferase
MSTASYLRHLLQRFRREPTRQLLLDGLGRLGVSVQPFYVFEETLSPDAAPRTPPDLRDADVRQLEPGDMQAVAAVPWRNLDEAFFLQRFESGNGCLGLFVGGELAAFSWYDLKECNYEGWRFPLNDDEAYLFDAFTLAPWRGKGVAPFLRHRVYEVLAAQGRRRFYSVSLKTNRAAIRFKEKLGGRIVDEGWWVGLFGRWGFGSKPPERGE